MSTSLWVALIVAIALFGGLLLPYLIEEITRGKIELGPRFPVGAGDTRPGSSWNPRTARLPPEPAPLSLRSVHVLFIALSIVVTAGTGVWGLMNREPVLGGLSLLVAVALVVYGSYFLRKIENIH